MHACITFPTTCFHFINILSQWVHRGFTSLLSVYTADIHFWWYIFVDLCNLFKMCDASSSVPLMLSALTNNTQEKTKRSEKFLFQRKNHLHSLPLFIPSSIFYSGLLLCRQQTGETQGHSTFTKTNVSLSAAQFTFTSNQWWWLVVVVK